MNPSAVVEIFQSANPTKKPADLRGGPSGLYGYTLQHIDDLGLQSVSEFPFVEVEKKDVKDQQLTSTCDQA